MLFSNNRTGVANTAVGVTALLGMNGGSANAAFGDECARKYHNRQ